MKATLLVSVYNNTDFLKAVLDSLRAQTCKNFEIVISEDGNSEKMRAFIQAYPFEQPHQHLCQPDLGWRKNLALNRAIQASNTDYLILIDGDCVLHPRFIEMHLRHAKQNCILAGKRIKLNDELSNKILTNEIPSTKIDAILKKGFFKLRKLGLKFVEEGIFISPESVFQFLPKMRKMSQLKGCNMSFPKKAIQDINGFDEDYIRPAIGEDIDLTWRFQMAGYKIKSLRNLAVQYHLYHKENWTSQEENSAMMHERKEKGLYRCLNGFQKLSNSAFEVRMYGAFDRFNYGDLLLPIVFKSILEESRPELKGHIHNYGVIRSDLSELGALPTHSLSDLYTHLSAQPSYVVLVGGEILSANWGRIYSFLSPSFSAYYSASKLFRSFNNKLARFLLKGKDERPFILDPDNFSKLKGVLYLGAGGRRKGHYPKQSVQSLEKASMLSCRDLYVKKSLSQNLNNVLLTPDLAVLVSTVFPYNTLQPSEKLSIALAEVKKYLFFQISNNELNKLDSKTLCNQLTELTETTKCKLILCPIGTALGHEDQIALAKISVEMGKSNSILIQEPTITDILYLISNASLYIGSSLHGIITSMSYAIPYLALRDHAKLKAYLETWGIDGLKQITKVQSIVSNAHAALQIDTKTLLASKDSQLAIAKKTLTEAIKQFV